MQCIVSRQVDPVANNRCPYSPPEGLIDKTGMPHLAEQCETAESQVCAWCRDGSITDALPQCYGRAGSSHCEACDWDVKRAGRVAGRGVRAVLGWAELVLYCDCAEGH